MDFKQLQNFCAIAQAGSLTAAARGVQLTQAALSRQMALLEAELQVELFRRNGRGVVLTAAGQQLLEHAHLILRQVALAKESVRANANTARGTLAVGLPPSLARTMVVPLVEAFQAELPEVALQSLDGLSSHLLELVSNAKLDCAVVYNVAPLPNVTMEALAEESLYLVSGPLDYVGEPPLKSSVTLSDVARLPLIVAGKSNTIHMTLTTALAAMGKTAQVVHEIANLNAILDMVRKGHGYAVVPLSGVHSCIGDPELRLHRVRRPALNCKLFTATATQSPDPLTDSAMKLLRRVVTTQLAAFDLEVENAITR